MASQKSTRAVKPSKNMNEAKNQACQWKYCDHECSWDTQCDNKYQFTNDGPKENDYKFCPGCGKPVALAGDEQPVTIAPTTPDFTQDSNAVVIAGAAPCSALDATSMSANGQYLVTLGEALQAGASDFSKHQGRLRATLDAVAKILAESADSWKRTAEGLRYDEPRGVRHALDVHVNLLRDLSRELSNPGSTKYAPNDQALRPRTPGLPSGQDVTD